MGVDVDAGVYVGVDVIVNVYDECGVDVTVRC